MKRRTTRILNFFAFNLLFFALYLNFVHKEKEIVPMIPSSEVGPTGNPPATIGENAEQFTKKDLAQTTTKEEETHNN